MRGAGSLPSEPRPLQERVENRDHEQGKDHRGAESGDDRDTQRYPELGAVRDIECEREKTGDCRESCQKHWAKPTERPVKDRIVHRHSVAAILIDRVNEYDPAVHYDSGKRHGADEHDEAKRRPSRH